MERRPPASKSPPRIARPRRRRAVAGGPPHDDGEKVIPLLSRLLEQSTDGSEAALFAKLHLAEALVERKPWAASVYARAVLRECPEEPRAWAILALGQTHLGHFRFAIHAYERALDLAPTNVAYAHNLGHLLDVAQGQPKRALLYLEPAYAAARGNLDILMSLLHALVRADRTERAVALIDSADVESATQLKLRKLVRSLAARQRDGFSGGMQLIAATHDVTNESPHERSPRRHKRKLAAAETDLQSVLDAGLAHLPFSAGERHEAQLLAQRFAESVTSASEARVTAAAIAWQVAHSAHLPLGAADVAAPFRVSLSAMRAAREALRQRLALA